MKFHAYSDADDRDGRRMINIKQITVGTLVLALGSAAAADEDMPNNDEILKVSLIRGWVAEDGTRLAALRVTLAPGWKTYWRVSGETGIPPVFDWSGSENLAGIEYIWPRPHVIEADGITVVGYKNELVLPIRFSAKSRHKAINANASLEIGVCKEVCMPVSTNVSALLNENEGADRFLIELALAEQPEHQHEAGLADFDCQISRTEDGFGVTATFQPPQQFGDHIMAIVEASNPALWVAPATVGRSGGQVEIKTTAVSYGVQVDELHPREIRMTLIGKDRAIDIQGCDAL